MLNKLKQSHTSIHIVQALEDNLSDHLSTENRRKYIAPFIETSRFQQVRNAVIHQNIIGWGNFTRGYISSKWRQCQTAQVSTNKRSHMAQWGCLLVKLTLELHLQIWNDRNQAIHGKTVAESRLKARAAVLQRVKDIYDHPPRLASRFQQITQVPLDIRLCRSTQQLKDWLHRVQHHQKVTHYLNSRRLPGQLTLQQAFRNRNCNDDTKTKFPP